MLVYRVFPYLDSAAARQPGHPGYLPRPQGHGRLDNPSEYAVWYFATTPEAAIGETFADITHWTEDMFGVRGVPGARRALGVFEVDEDRSVLDLDDARVLVRRALRPTTVIARQRSVTQGWALDIYRERTPDGHRRWAGIRWWSFHRPHWTVVAYWYADGEKISHRVVAVEELTVGHQAVLDAARSLGKVVS